VTRGNVTREAAQVVIKQQQKYCEPKKVLISYCSKNKQDVYLF
jgi:hypothetical protein